jgi:hypothetical protein
MQVKEAIRMLAKYHDQDEHIMIDWICRDAYGDWKEVTDDVWEDACVSADDCEYIIDNEMGRVLIDEVLWKNKEKDNGI